MKFLKRFFRSWFLDVREVQEYAKLIAHCRIRRECELPFFGENEKCDKELEEIVNDFFEPGKEKKTYEGKYAEISSWLEKSTASANDRKEYLRVSHRIAKEAGKETRAESIILEYEKVYEEPLKPIKKAEIWEARSDFLKEFKKESAELQNYYNSKAEFFSFSLKEFAQYYLPFVPFIVTSGGYLYASIVYGSFGIETSQFFSLDDYLDGSIEKILHAGYFVVCFLAYRYAAISRYRTLPVSQVRTRRLPWRGIIPRHRDLAGKMQSEYRKREKFLHVTTGIMYFVIFLLMLIVKYVKSKLPVSYFLQTSFIVCAFYLITYFIFYSTRRRKYFKNDLRYILLLSIFLFFFSIYSDARIRIAEIKDCPTRVFENEAGTGKSADEVSLIGSNNRYIFLQRKNRIEILPLMKTDEIVILPTDSEDNGNECSLSTIELW